MKQREIKFRVWDNDLKIWINNIGMKPNNVLTNGTEKRFKVMQFTGLLDKKGNEIYEGDIISAGGDDLCTVEYRGVEFMRHVISWELRNQFYPFRSHHNYEIKGNIYQNRELLIKKI